MSPRHHTTTISERNDQLAHRRERRGPPIEPDADQHKTYSVVERRLNRLEQWCGIALRSDATVRNHHATVCLAAPPMWVKP